MMEVHSLYLFFISSFIFYSFFYFFSFIFLLHSFFYLSSFFIHFLLNFLSSFLYAVELGLAFLYTILPCLRSILDRTPGSLVFSVARGRQLPYPGWYVVGKLVTHY